MAIFGGEEADREGVVKSPGSKVRGIYTSTSSLVSEIREGQDHSPLYEPSIPFLHFLERLKNIPRAGWVKRGVQSPESVSDHSYRMVVLCLMLEVRYQRPINIDR